jgi:hypothetical protein
MINNAVCPPLSYRYLTFICFGFLREGLAMPLAWNPLQSPGWPQTQQSPFCILRAGKAGIIGTEAQSSISNTANKNGRGESNLSRRYNNYILTCTL